MFQTFSGNSRRPRQVNLSGQNTNPFAAKSWNPSASGTQKTVANAQQERQLRQQERERLNASKRIQRAWRAHKTRRELADSRRKVWDDIKISDEVSPGYGSRLVEQAQLVVAFFNSRRQDDIERLTGLSQRIYRAGYDSFLARQDIQPQLRRLATIILEALIASLPNCPSSLLQFLLAIISHCPNTFPKISQPYYKYLSTLATRKSSGVDKEMIIAAISIPFEGRIDLDQSDETVINAYSSFALYLLTTPDLQTLLGSLSELAGVVNIGLLSTAVVREFSSDSATRVPSNNRLWLLAHFIAIHRLQQRSIQEPEFLRALSLQISTSSGEIVGRIDASDSEVFRENPENDEDPKYPQSPLPSFIKVELLSLVNQASISGLLARFNVDYAKAEGAGEEDASLLASYALTLLRIFPQRGDEIRMWLYLGSLTISSGIQVPALKVFWQAMRSTAIFSAVRKDSKEALTILRSQIPSVSMGVSSRETIKDREWRTILLFLELYTFVLRFTDDEEFLNGSLPSLAQPTEPVSRIRESALPLEDVKQLTLFLKNLAFTTYYNAGELSDDYQQVTNGGLGTYFGTSTASRSQQPEDDAIAKHVSRRPFAGIAGMTFDYVRTIVTGVMRMLYERDSRRRFLPKDHWLMTSRFEMEGFIPAVVMEEERQHQVREEGEDEETDADQDYGPRYHDLALVGMARPRRAQQIENLRRQQQRATRKKLLAQVGPRLEILQNMPFCIPFETRVQIFRQFVYLDQSRRRGGHVDPDTWRMSVVQNAMMTQGQRGSGREVLGRHHAKIRRDKVFQDAYEQFYDLGEGLKEPIQITFVDKFATIEAGIDGGGVTKEFLTSVTNEAFRAEYGPNLFSANDQNLLYPTPYAIEARRRFLRQAGLKETDPEWKEEIRDILRQYEFLGRIVGKCLYEGILVDIGFAGFFLLKWAASGAAGSESGYRANINDLRDLDEGLYQGLLKLKNYPGNVEDLSLDFTITDRVANSSTDPQGDQGEFVTRELIPNGSNIAVTNENRPLYVSYVVRHRLQVEPYQQTQAFLKGLGQIIKPSWLSMFNQSELQTLVGGDSSEIDVEDLRSNTLYGGVYQIGDDGLEHSTIKLFWEVMKELDDSDRRKVLKYVTSTPRAPLLGFSQLNPQFSIRDAGGDEERLPSTSTCVNLLKLPRYSTAETLRAKLLYAVNSGAGFDLS